VTPNAPFYLVIVGTQFQNAVGSNPCGGW